MRKWSAFTFVLLLGSCPALPASAQTTIDGDTLTMRSSGFNPGGTDDWTLNENGYVGTYITLASPGMVTIDVEASGAQTPHMNIVLDDTKAGFDVTSGFNNYQYTFDLPAGTHFLRTEFNNDIPTASRQLTVRDLTVTGATVSNSSNATTLNANALNAADTYIQNFRKGDAQLQLVGVPEGTNVDIKLRNHAFNFGTAVGGSSGTNTYLGSPTAGSTAESFQEALLATRINSLTPENDGKWNANEGTRDSVNMSGADQLLNFAEANGLRARMHNVIWGSQQPSWVSNFFNNGLLDQAVGGSASAAAELRTEVSERIDYYVGDGVGADRAQQYIELDVYNESVHTSQYMDVYGPDGIAEIYQEVADAVAAAGSEAKLYVNEYNVLQDDGDYYGNWYRQHIETINNATIADTVTGIGIQSYENNNIGTTFDAHYAARKMQTLQNLSVLGLPITLTEFGVKDPTNPTDAAQMMEETLRIVFGTSEATGFTMWGIYQGDIYRGAAALYDANWNLTVAGNRWIDLMTIDGDGDAFDDWDTDLTTSVSPDGTIDFTGFYGDYEITVDGKTFDLSLVKGTEEYTLVVNLPADFNDDDKVDFLDLAIWEGSYGTGNGGDADGDGDTDGKDFLVWQQLNGFGVGLLKASPASIPEPSVFAMFVCLGLVWNCLRIRRD